MSVPSPSLALDAALDEHEYEDEGEESLAPPLAALDAVGGHKTISFFGASCARRAPAALLFAPL
jgi:hypothetical protein